MTKKEVRALAVKWDLPVKEKPESQEICFFGDRDYRSFLKRYLPDKYFKPGEIIDKDGNVLGKHEGLINYTIGQRKGIDQLAEGGRQKVEVDLQHQTSDLKPLYVIGFDAENNRLIVGADEAIYSRGMVVTDLNWFDPSLFCHFDQSGEIFSDLKVKIRYRHAAVPCKMTCQPERSEESRDSSAMSQNDNIQVIFDKPQRAITPGQSAVFYSGDEVLGGGYIK
jgi:tRNA-specific 2-thiouridylase